jgi:hypothetical protein
VSTPENNPAWIEKRHGWLSAIALVLARGAGVQENWGVNTVAEAAAVARWLEARR